MLNFLKQTRKFLNSKDSLCIVIGNESCDLDSAVCALSLALCYQQSKGNEANHFIPVLNVARQDYQLKTEVKYLFNQYAIYPEHLTFRDELEEELLSKSTFILVDHHVSPFADRCVEVFDHRSFDKDSRLPKDCQVHIERVGSCATLIAEKVLSEFQPKTCPVVLALLRSAIILDTVNFSVAAERHTPKDISICDALEEKLLTTFATPAENLHRNELFQALVGARAEIGNLSCEQLLRKDLKVLTSSDGKIKIAIPGLPMTVQDFIEKPEAEGAIQKIAEHLDCVVVLLIGMVVDGERVHRDIGLINMTQSDIFDAITARLIGSIQPDFQLEKYKCGFMEGNFYKQNNITATRKHIIPILNTILNQCTTGSSKEERKENS